MSPSTASCPSRLRRAGRGRDDRGSASLELAIVFPVVLLMFFGAVQAALFFHARSVAMAAAQEGVAAARVEGGTAGDGAARAREFVADVGGDSVLGGLAVSPSRTAQTAAVTVSGRTVSVLPGVSGMVVSQTAAGPVERFTTVQDG